MFITDDFVFIHVPKTGGTFVEVALRNLCEATRRPYVDSATALGRCILGTPNQHEAVPEIPRAHCEKSVLFGVRNPYDYYVSLYEFGWWRTHPEEEFDTTLVAERYPRYPDLTFSEFVKASNDWRLWPTETRLLGVEMERREIGLLTWKLITMLALDPRNVFENFKDFEAAPFKLPFFPTLNALRTNFLAEDLVKFLRTCGVPEQDTEFIRQLGVINPPGGARPLGSDWRAYYDTPLRSFVRAADRVVFTCWREFDE